MSQIVQNLISKNSATPVLINGENLIKLVPAARVSAIKDEIMTVARGGNVEHLELLLKALLEDPAIALVGGIGFDMGTVQSIKTIDSRLNTVAMKKVQETLASESDVEFKNVLHCINEEIATGDGVNQPNFTSLARDRISFSIHKFKIAVNRLWTQEQISYVDMSGVYATIYIPSFYLRYKWATGMYKSFKFPDVLVGTKVIYTPQKDGKYNLSFDKNPCVLQKLHYKHPFVYPHNKICTGNFSTSEYEKNLMRMTFLNGVVYFLKQVSQIITNGYHERVMPAFHHLTDNVYHAFLVKEHASPEVEAEILGKKASLEVKNEIDAVMEDIRKRGARGA